jgi:sulfonate transport system permease protein
MANNDLLALHDEGRRSRRARALARRSTASASASTSASAAPSTQTDNAPASTVDIAAGRLSLWRIGGWLLPIAVLAIIELLVRLAILPENLVPAPSSIALSLWQMGAERVARHVGTSVLRVASGFVLGACAAAIIGGAMGLSRRIELLLDPTFQALRAIPSLAWVPVLLLWMGIDESPKITLIAIGAFFPIQLSVLAGIQGVDRKLVELGKAYRLGRLALFWRILLPAALPQIFTGLRTGLSLAWMFMVAAELIAANRGLGFLLSDGRETGRPDIVFSAIILLAILGKISDSVLRALEIRLLSWRDVSTNNLAVKREDA